MNPRRSFLIALPFLRSLVLGFVFMALPHGPAFAQGAMTNGENHLGEISLAGEVDTWTFTADQGDALILTIGEVPREPDPGFWPRIQVTGPTGAALVCGNCWGDRASRMAATAPLTGTYTVLVSSFTAGAVGDYVLRLAKVPGAFVVPGGDHGGAVTNGANHLGRIEVADLDVWSFTASQGDALILTLGEVPVGPGDPDPGFWPWLRVYDPTGDALVCGNCWGDVSTRMAATAPLTGTYTVVVAGYTGDIAGDYLLRLARAPATFEVPIGDHGGPMENGANHAGRIERADVDMWTFAASQGDALILTVGEVPVGPGVPDPGFWPWLRLYDPTGNVLVCGNCWGDASTRMQATAPLTGTYTVVVASYTGDVAGDYLLRLARTPGTFIVPAGDHGGPLSNGANHAGRIERADLDLWTFTANQGDALILTVGEVPVGPGVPDPGFWPWLRVFGPTGSTLVCGNCWGDVVTHMSATAPLSGTYTVVVAGYTGDVAGDYVLRLAKTPGSFEVPSGDHGGAMTNATSHPGRIERADLDIWTFAAAQGTTINVSISEVPVGPSEPDPGFWPWIRVFGPTGATVVCGNCWGNQTAQMSTTAPLGGTYTVVVASASVAAAAAGDYLLTVNGAIAATPPTTVDDGYGTALNTPLPVPAPGLLDNDNSNGGGPMTAELMSSPSNGVLALNANGGFTYTPNGGFTGTDSFTYRAVSSVGPGNTATVSITVSDPTTVQPPTGLYASSIAGNTVTLRWTPPAAGLPPTDYLIEGGVSPGQTMATLVVGGATPIYTFPAPTGAFYVRVHTLSGANSSEASNEIRIFVNVSAAPSAPADLVGLVNGSSLALAWRNTFAGGAPGGVVLDVSGALTTSLPLGLTDSFQFNGVPGGTYTLSLRAINSAGSSPASDAITLIFPDTCTGAPFAPANFLAYRVGRTLFVVWDPATTGPAPTSFVLTVTGAFAGTFGTPGRTLSGTVGPGTYHLSVAAANACGSSLATPVQIVVVP